MTDRLDGIRLAVMVMAENYVPIHDMLEGEVAYFLRQGYTREQARALTAAEFVGTFGAAIGMTATQPEDE